MQRLLLKEKEVNTVLKRLLLKKKIVNNTEVYYVFDRDGKLITLPESEARVLISTYPPDKRNCKLTQGRVSMKANAGSMAVDVLEADRSTKRLKSTNKRVNIFTSQKYFGKYTIWSNDNWFNKLLFEEDFLRRHSEIIMDIDAAKIVDYNMQTIITPFGTTSLNNLSTGLKTVLNICFIKEKWPERNYIVNINECGNNALEYVFELVSNSNIGVYLTYYPIYMPDEYTYYINNKIITDTDELNNYIF